RSYEPVSHQRFHSTIEVNVRKTIAEHTFDRRVQKRGAKANEPHFSFQAAINCGFRLARQVTGKDRHFGLSIKLVGAQNLSLFGYADDARQLFRFLPTGRFSRSAYCSYGSHVNSRAGELCTLDRMRDY